MELNSTTRGEKKERNPHKTNELDTQLIDKGKSGQTQKTHGEPPGSREEEKEKARQGGERGAG